VWLTLSITLSNKNWLRSLATIVAAAAHERMRPDRLAAAACAGSPRRPR